MPDRRVRRRGRPQPPLAGGAVVSVAADDALQAAFDLPSMRADIADWVDALRAGRGFVLVRGFPTDELTPRETEVAYVGLGLQMGTPVSQNAAGDLLGHVRDEGVARRDPSVRLYQTL